MPILVTFDVERPTPQELNRLRGAFERLGWARLGNTAYRYPDLRRQGAVEDWFNHVIPALMLLRAYARHVAAGGQRLRRFSLDTQSSTGCNPLTSTGTLPAAAAEIAYSQPSRSGRAFGLQNGSRTCKRGSMASAGPTLPLSLWLPLRLPEVSPTAARIPLPDCCQAGRSLDGLEIAQDNAVE